MFFVKKSEVIQSILTDRFKSLPKQTCVEDVFAPSNIALCKYWGKRNTELNLPVTSSLSVSLLDRGSSISLVVNTDAVDNVYVNDQVVMPDSDFYRRFVEFLNLFREPSSWYVTAKIRSTVPVGAGLASSACGFASLTLALDQLLNWQLDKRTLSILARFGSGSACRSLWQGFVEWQAGVREDGTDSYGIPLADTWPGLCMGLLIFSSNQKPISSREAMRITVETSLAYAAWPNKVSSDLLDIKTAIQTKDFSLLGEASESNALAMHATMLAATPSVCYDLPGTQAAINRVRSLRADGVPVYFTQDAGPNIKLIFLKKDAITISEAFPGVQVINLF